MRKLSLLLLLAVALSAQSPIQVTTVPLDYYIKSEYKVTLPPTAPNSFIVMYGMLGNSLPVITDSQGNIWQQANRDTIELQYVSASNGGAETITIRYAKPQYFKAIIANFPCSYALSGVIPSRNVPLITSQSLNYNDETATPASFPLTTLNPNELVIGYGNSDALYPPAIPSVTPAPGWTYLGGVPNHFMQYTIMPNPGTVTSSWTQPFLGEGVYATMGIVSFKPIGGCK